MTTKLTEEELRKHPFVRWWITESGLYQPNNDLLGAGATPEFQLSLKAWNAAIIGERNRKGVIAEMCGK